MSWASFDMTPYEGRKTGIMKRFGVSASDADNLLDLDAGESVTVTLNDGSKAEAFGRSNFSDPEEYYVDVHLRGQHVCTNYKYLG